MNPTPKKFQRKITITARASYLLYLPPGYASDRKKRWPVMLFLHGAGERGENLDMVGVHGPLKSVAQGQEFPVIIVAPQCPTGEWWRAEVLAALLDEIFSETQPDTSLTKHVALMTNVIDMGASNAKSMREILIDAEREATDIISQRMSEGLKDIRGAIAPEKRRKAA